jgi:hypothetical protein
MPTKVESEALSQQWCQHIHDWEQSGQSRKQFCRDRGLSYHRLCYWQRKLSQSQQASDSSGFVAVTCRTAPATAEGLSIRLPNGLVVQGITAGNVAVVQQLLGRLT